MAEGLMRQTRPEVVVYSAGLHALAGASVDCFAVEAAWRKGIDIRGHRARQISTWMVEDADLILTMDRAQKSEIEVSYPELKHKVWRLGEYGNYDIPDPYQKAMAVFQESLFLITRGVEDWTKDLLSSNANANANATTADMHHFAATPL